MNLVKKNLCVSLEEFNPVGLSLLNISYLKLKQSVIKNIHVISLNILFMPLDAVVT